MKVSAIRQLRNSLFLAVTLGSCLLAGHSFADDTVSSLRASEIQLRNQVEQEPANGTIRIKLAEIYLKLGNNNAALAELLVAHQLHVNDTVLAPLTAQAMVATGDFANLLRDVPEGNRPPKVESAVRTYRGIAQQGINETDQALASLQAAVRLDPSNIVAKLALARLYFGAKQFDAATNMVDDVLKIAPNNGAALDLKGLSREYRGDINGAMGWFSGAIARNPRNAQALLDRANLELGRNDLDAAEKDTTAAMALKLDTGMAIYLDAVIMAKRGKYQEADAVLDKIRPVMGQVSDIYFLAGEIKFKLGQKAQAEDYLDKFVAQHQNEPQAFQLLGIMAMERGDSERAVTMLEKAHSLAPGDSKLSVILSQAYLAHGESNKAVALMDEAKAQQPKNSDIEAERALTHFTHGDPGASVGELTDLFKGGSGNLNAAPSLILANLRNGNVDAAANTAQDLVNREPSNTFYQELLGATRVAQHNYAAAEQIFKAILAKDPTSPAARMSLAQVYIFTNRSQAAVGMFQDLVAKNPNDMKAKQSLAAVYVQIKNDPSAIKVLTDAGIPAKGDVAPGIQLAAIYERQKNWPQAVATAAAIQQRFPQDLTATDTLGRLYAESGDSKSSLAVYAKATAAFPQSSAIWNNYATVLSQAQNYPAALDAISKAHALVPKDARAARGLIFLTNKVKGVDAAIAVGKTMDTPQYPSGSILAAGILATSGNVPQAIALLQDAQAKTPTTASAILLAKYLSDSGQKDKATTELESWTKSHPDDYQAIFALAQLYGSSGNYAASLQKFEWLASKHPDDAVILNNLAWLYSLKKDPRARAVAERAYKAAPQSSSVADTLGWIIASQGDAAGALKYLQAAGTASPGDPSIQYHLAYVLVKVNQTAAAKPILQKVLASNAGPDVKDPARQLLAKIGG